MLLAENCRVPFDDPNTHLELTMIHEVMVLDHSGPPLAVILHGAALKLLLFAVLLAEAVLPIGELPPLVAAVALGGAVLVVAVGGWAGGVADGAPGFPARAAAADDGVPAVPVRAAGGVEGRRRVNDTLNLLIGLAMGLNLLRPGQQPPALAHPRGGHAGHGAGRVAAAAGAASSDWLLALVAVARSPSRAS